MKKKKIIIAAFVALLLGVGLMVWFGQQSLKKDGLYYSGTVEAATISNLSFQVGGQGGEGARLGGTARGEGPAPCGA